MGENRMTTNQINELIQGPGVYKGQISDGFHTFYAGDGFPRNKGWIRTL
jgi:hypothetical protein